MSFIDTVPSSQRPYDHHLTETVVIIPIGLGAWRWATAGPKLLKKQFILSNCHKLCLKKPIFRLEEKIYSSIFWSYVRSKKRESTPWPWKLTIFWTSERNNDFPRVPLVFGSMKSLLVVLYLIIRMTVTICDRSWIITKALKAVRKPVRKDRQVLVGVIIYPKRTPNESIRDLVILFLKWATKSSWKTLNRCHVWGICIRCFQESTRIILLVTGKYRSPEQDGFQSRFCTIDQIHTVN